MRYVVVEARAAQETIKRLREAGLMDLGVRVLREQDLVLVPVTAEVPPDVLGQHRIIERESAPYSPRARTYRDLLDLPPGTLSLLPRSFDVVGDIAILKLGRTLESYAPAIAEALTRWNPAIRRVALDGGVEGDLRVRALRPIIGDDLVTEHRENGLRFRIDLGSAYFSPRLSGERLRVAEQVRAGERVLDMFAGVGPFSILIAKRCPEAEVVAVDANPAACDLLLENARLNKVKVDVREGRIEELAAGLGEFNRVIMNLPRSSVAFFPFAMGVLRKGGAGTINHVHLYTVAGAEVPQDEEHVKRPDELVERIRGMREAGAKAGWSVDVDVEKLKTFATRVWVWRLDARVSPLPPSPPS